MNPTFRGGSPLGPIYPIVPPTGAIYTNIHHPYQNQSVVVPPNMCQYSSMQVTNLALVNLIFIVICLNRRASPGLEVNHPSVFDRWN